MSNPYLPLSWYVDKLQRGEPFTSLLYGDGEFTAMSGEVTGQIYTRYKEVVTKRLVQELKDSLAEPGDDIIRGTDLFLVYPETYRGTYTETVTSINAKIKALMTDEQISQLVDGTVWDVAVREGKLGPLIKVLRQLRVAFVGSAAITTETDLLRPGFTIAVRNRNAAGQLDLLESALAAAEWDCCVVCMGLGAIPLIMRLRKRRSQATYLDLGSTFDVFVRIGADRGWRRELYEDDAKWRRCVEANLEGL